LNIKHKVSILISLQIILIIGSFAVLVYFENENSLVGNSINVSGKNRFLAMSVHNEIENFLVGKGKQKPLAEFDVLEENIKLLRLGSKSEEFPIASIKDRFLDDIEKLELKFMDFKASGREVIESHSISTTMAIEKSLEFEKETIEFVEVADDLTNKLGFYEKVTSDRLIQLEIALMISNIALHILLVFLILSLFRQESQRLLRLEKLSAIGELAARVSHDLRNPLSIIKMAFELIKQKENLDEKSLEKMKTIDNAIARMTHQIDDVMNYVKTSPLNKSEIEFSNLVKESISRIVIPQDIDIEHQESSVKIACDKEKMTAVLSNIILNSIQAMDNKGKITITLASNPKDWEIRVSNSGPPIPPEIIEKIFEPLFTTREKGTGLGLATCKNIISEHNGIIYVKNNPTTFIIKLPKN